MKNQDIISKRILSVAIAVAIVFCSASLFVHTLNFAGNAKAANPSANGKAENGNLYQGCCPVACCSAGNFIYYITTENGYTFGKKSIMDFKEGLYK